MEPRQRKLETTSAPKKPDAHVTINAEAIAEIVAITGMPTLAASLSVSPKKSRRF